MTTNTTNMEALLAALSGNLSAEDILYASITSDISVAVTSKRIDMNLTQKDFATLLGKSQTMVSKWENAECNFTIRTLVELAQKLNLNLTVSLTEKEINSSNTQLPKSNVIQFPGRYYIDSPFQTWTHAESPEEELIEM